MARPAKADSVIPVRLAFTPSRKAREYFNELVKRLTRQRRIDGIDAHITHREAFDHLVELARHGEKSQQFFRPPLAEVRRPDGKQT